MQDKRYLRSLLDYNVWANAELYRVARDLPPEELRERRHPLLDSILVSLNHLLVVDRIWLAHLRGVAHGFENLRTVVHDDVESLWEARQKTDAVLAGYVDDLDPAALDEEVEYVLIGGNRGRLTRAAILTHLALHGSYHRGWIVDMLGQIPVPPPIMDLPVFARANEMVL